MTNDYYEVFKRRALNKGRSFKDRVRFNSRIHFERFLISSPDAIDVRVNNSENCIRVGSIYEKESDTLFKRFILSRLEDNLKVGDFLYWEDTIWLLYKKEIDTIKAYDKFEAIDCKHSLKWIDNFGKINECPCYLIAQLDNIIQPNFRTWNNMITPQPNKNLKIITSRKDIVLGEKFLLDGTAWHVVESDYISIKGILFLSLIEDKIDLYDDYTEEDLADFVDLNKFVIKVPSENITLGINEQYKLDARIELNGNFYSDELLFEVIEGAKNVSIDNNFFITGNEEGTSIIRVSMEESPEIFVDINISVQSTPATETIYLLKGDKSIKWGRTKEYTCVKIVNGVETLIDASFSVIDNNHIIEKVVTGTNAIFLTANSDNKKGEFTIECTPVETNETITKQCEVISLWM